jgi:hypothetical protein
MSSASTTAGDGSSTSSEIVCPFIAELVATSTLNIDSHVASAVTISNIDHIIDVSAVDLAAAFDCAGWGVNKTLNQNQQLIGSLVVSLTNSGSDLKSILSAAVADGQLKSYLEDEYEAAFELAFPNVKRSASGTDAAADDDANVGVSGELTDGAGGAADAGNSNLAASTVTLTATVSEYDFAIDISGDEAAAAMYDGLTEARLNTLFMQLPYVANIVDYTDASGNKSNAKLPLKVNDTITFVFDISVSASTDSNTSNGTEEHADEAEVNVPTENENGLGFERQIQMDLGSRRVAFKIPQSVNPKSA